MFPCSTRQVTKLLDILQHSKLAAHHHSFARIILKHGKFRDSDLLRNTVAPQFQDRKDLTNLRSNLKMMSAELHGTAMNALSEVGREALLKLFSAGNSGHLSEKGEARMAQVEAEAIRMEVRQEVVDMERAITKVQAWFKLRSSAFQNACKSEVQAAQAQLQSMQHERWEMMERFERQLERATAQTAAMQAQLEAVMAVMNKKDAELRHLAASNKRLIRHKIVSGLHAQEQGQVDASKKRHTDTYSSSPMPLRGPPMVPLLNVGHATSYSASPSHPSSASLHGWGKAPGGSEGTSNHSKNSNSSGPSPHTMATEDAADPHTPSSTSHSIPSSPESCASRGIAPVLAAVHKHHSHTPENPTQTSTTNTEHSRVPPAQPDSRSFSLPTSGTSAAAGVETISQVTALTRATQRSHFAARDTASASSRNTEVLRTLGTTSSTNSSPTTKFSWRPGRTTGSVTNSTGEPIAGPGQSCLPVSRPSTPQGTKSSSSFTDQKGVDSQCRQGNIWASASCSIRPQSASSAMRSNTNVVVAKAPAGGMKVSGTRQAGSKATCLGNSRTSISSAISNESAGNATSASQHLVLAHTPMGFSGAKSGGVALVARPKSALASSAVHMSVGNAYGKAAMNSGSGSWRGEKPGVKFSIVPGSHSQKLSSSRVGGIMEPAPSLLHVADTAIVVPTNTPGMLDVENSAATSEGM